MNGDAESVSMVKPNNSENIDQGKDINNQRRPSAPSLYALLTAEAENTQNYHDRLDRERQRVNDQVSEMERRECEQRERDASLLEMERRQRERDRQYHNDLRQNMSSQNVRTNNWPSAVRIHQPPGGIRTAGCSYCHHYNNNSSIAANQRYGRRKSTHT